MQKVLVRTTHVRYGAKPFGASHLVTNVVQTPPLTGESHSTSDTSNMVMDPSFAPLGFWRTSLKSASSMQAGTYLIHPRIPTCWNSAWFIGGAGPGLDGQI